MILSYIYNIQIRNRLKKLPSPIENIIDLFSDVCPQSQELSVDPVQGCFKEVSLSGIFTVKQFKELKYTTTEMLLNTTFQSYTDLRAEFLFYLQNKFLIDVFLRYVRLKVR